MTSDSQQIIEAYRKRVAREKAARAAAERLLEEKTKELYAAQLREQGKTEEALRSREELANSLQELRETQSALLQASKMEALGTLAGGIAHEINTPIQFISDNLSFLGDSFDDLKSLVETYERVIEAVPSNGQLSEPLQKLAAAKASLDISFILDEFPQAIEQSVDGVAQVSKIVRAMKSYAHGGTEEKTISDINATIKSAVTLSQNEWKHVAQLELHLAPDLPVIPCHAAELNQVVLNLLINAAHAIGECNKGQDGRIEIVTFQTGDMVQIEIRDNGSGIPDEIRNRIFEPFFSTKEVGVGSGQGLAIVHKIITENHGGSVDFTSSPDTGTCFTILLPVSDVFVGVG